MAKLQLGNIAFGATVGRQDAFHAPCVLVNAAKGYSPDAGQKVFFTNRTFTQVTDEGGEDYHAIVDPFLEYIPADACFWVLVNPIFVKDLTHQFALEMFSKSNEIDPDYGDDDDTWCNTSRCS